ncbi:MAG: site-2 protease family protein [Ruminococcus sp.]|jgi:Zn-dependent protease|nr:site-2 protease family protein [Ruminococcus sp.]
MISLRIKKIRVIFRFGFFASITLLILLNESVYAIFGMYACLIHEAGHLIAMKYHRVPVREIMFYSAGVRIEPGIKPEITPFFQNLLILVSGAAANMITAVISLAVFRLTDLNNAWIFYGVNLVIGVFNLLPLRMFDGGRIIGLFVNNFSSVEKAAENEAFRTKIDFLLIILTAIAFFILGNRNISLYLTLCYFAASEFFTDDR